MTVRTPEARAVSIPVRRVGNPRPQDPPVMELKLVDYMMGDSPALRVSAPYMGTSRSSRIYHRAGQRAPFDGATLFAAGPAGKPASRANGLTYMALGRARYPAKRLLQPTETGSGRDLDIPGHSKTSAG
jgi:hypothetical protein